MCVLMNSWGRDTATTAGAALALDLDDDMPAPRPAPRVCRLRRGLLGGGFAGDVVAGDAGANDEALRFFDAVLHFARAGDEGAAVSGTPGRGRSESFTIVLCRGEGDELRYLLRAISGLFCSRGDVRAAAAAASDLKLASSSFNASS